MKEKDSSIPSVVTAVTPCANPPAWPLAPAPKKKPLDVMEWATGRLKDQFGCTRDGGAKFHAGIDIKAAIGTPCYAVEDAKVRAVGSGTDLGKYVTISFQKDGKTYGVAYCHLRKQSVEEGDDVKAGDKLGETGITGNAEAENPHLHFDMQDQIWVGYEDAAERSKHGVNTNSYV